MIDIPRNTAADLTRHIETRYHAMHREHLPVLAQMAERIESVHFGEDTVPVGLADLLERMIGSMDLHMKKEELILFPAIRDGGMAGLENPISAMRADHDHHEAEVAEIHRLTHNLTLPDGACGTWTALYRGLTEFLGDLEEHVRLENDVLFPQFEPETQVGA